MRRCLLTIACVLVLFLIGSLSQTVPTPGREHFQKSEVTYAWAKDGAGNRLRMFVTRPKGVPGKVPAIFFVGWLSCDSVEYPNGESDGFGAIFWRLIEQSGYATVRLDKAGIGESQGDCAKLDFETELAGYRDAFDAMLKYYFIDPQKIFVIGLSNGGGTSALIPRDHPVRGYIAASSWGRTWYEHMLDHERMQALAAGKTPAEVNNGAKVFTEFYNQYLVRRMTPGEVLAKHPEWKPWWSDAPDGQYGRPAAFYQQLQALNLGEVWQKVTAPVLVVWGTGDNIMSAADARAIADNVNQTHPGMAKYVEIPGADHLLTVKRKLADDVAPTMLKWMQEQLAK